ncbi:MAG: ABC transporter permease [Prevotellaceae bacterium]|jgi:lipopolysaccharide transport system permease protein|nr:ABC transporter permease [Prevotellaceae bacterium]
MSELEQKWDTVIKPKTGLFNIDFKEMWRYRDLLTLFVKRDIITQYKQTILGPAWYFIQPIFSTIMYMVVFGNIAKISTDGLPQPLFYLAGISLWTYFSTCLNNTSSTFLTNASIFGKVYFPRLIMPITAVISALVRFFIQLLLFFAVYFYYIFFTDINIAINTYALLFPFLVVLMAGLSLGFGILISSMTTKYRDLTLLFGFFVSLWMYATPVIYPLSTITDPKLQMLVALNPLTSIFEFFKYGFLGAGVVEWWQLGYSTVFMIVLLGIGIVVFNRVQRSFMDTV